MKPGSGMRCFLLRNWCLSPFALWRPQLRNQLLDTFDLSPSFHYNWSHIIYGPFYLLEQAAVTFDGRCYACEKVDNRLPKGRWVSNLQLLSSEGWKTLEEDVSTAVGLAAEGVEVVSSKKLPSKGINSSGVGRSLLRQEGVLLVVGFPGCTPVKGESLQTQWCLEESPHLVEFECRSSRTHRHSWLHQYFPFPGSWDSFQKNMRELITLWLLLYLRSYR